MCIWKTTKPKKAKSRDEASEMPDRNKDSPVTGPGPSHIDSLTICLNLAFSQEPGEFDFKSKAQIHLGEEISK